jgi:uncharacterized protein YjiS (DUF1127 family)
MHLKSAVTDLAFAKVMARFQPFARKRNSRHPSWAPPGKRANVLSSLFCAGLRALRRSARRQATIRLLEGLSDDVLKDIGLHRSEIRSIVHHPDDRLPRLTLDI